MPAKLAAKCLQANPAVRIGTKRPAMLVERLSWSQALAVADGQGACRGVHGHVGKYRGHVEKYRGHVEQSQMG